MKRNDAIQLQLHPNFTHFLTRVVHLAKLEINQRRFAPLLARITRITGPLHRNTQFVRDLVDAAHATALGIVEGKHL
jgi:hypothetical protein